MTFAEHRRHYRQEHRTLGCRLTHMFGVPLILTTLPALIFWGWICAAGCFVFGWFLQFLGHFVWEKNKPVLFSDPKNPLTYFYAVIFVGEEWLRLLTFRSLTDPEDKS